MHFFLWLVYIFLLYERFLWNSEDVLPPIALRKRNVIQLFSDEKFKRALLFHSSLLFLTSVLTL